MGNVLGKTQEPLSKGTLITYMYIHYGPESVKNVSNWVRWTEATEKPPPLP